jgi:hypothetical protein
MTKMTEDMTAAPKAAFNTGFEKLQAASTTMTEHSKANLEAIMEATKINMKSLEDAGSIATAHVKNAGETAAAAMKTLASSKSIHEAVEMQADYTRGALDAYFADFNKIADVFLGAIKASAKPISDRMSASYTAMQSVK